MSNEITIKNPQQQQQQQQHTYQGGLSGLANLGNTCYLNSCLQCLFHNKDIISYFLSEAYLDDVRQDANKLEIMLLNKFVKTLEGTWEENCTIIPESFKRLLGLIDMRYRGNSQHDSHEVLVFILDKLHETLKYPVSMNLKTSSDIKDSESLTLTREAFKTWSKYYGSNYSFIISQFYGQFHAYTHCKECNNKINNFDPFCFLSVPLTNDNLINCIKDYMKSDSIQDGGYTCEKCNEQHNNVSREVKIWTYPKTLIIQLKRFTSGSSSGSKIVDKFIDFPLNSLDLSQFRSRCSISKAPKPYNLYAISCHTGNLNSGHYWSYVKHQENWFLFNDTQVSQINNLSEIVTSKAYLLFYQMVGC